MAEAAVVVKRGDLRENIIRADIAVLDDREVLYKKLGDPHKVTYMRSTAKPIQAIACLQTGAYRQFDLTKKELAVMCASHNGEPMHIEAVAGILNKIGLDESNLLCGDAYPYGGANLEDYRQKCLPKRAIVNNCSGKHAAILASCQAMGWDIGSYYLPQHPAQQLILSLISQFSSYPRADIGIGIDGCGVSVFAMPLYNMAKTFSRLLSCRNIDQSLTPYCREITAAIWQNPLMLAGSGEFDSLLAAVCSGRIIGKRGADGVYQAACQEGPAFALKLEDGDSRFLPLLAYEVLQQLDVLTKEEAAQLSAFGVWQNRNCRGEQVGEAQAIFKLTSL